MAVESLKIVNFDMKSDGEDQKEQKVPSLSLITLSDDRLIELIVKQLSLKRRVLAGNQVRIYFNKITSHPEMRSEYIQKIKQLIVYEKKKKKKRVDK